METTTDFASSEVGASKPTLGIAKSIGLIVVFYVVYGVVGGVLSLFGVEFGTAYSFLVSQVAAWLATIRLAALGSRASVLKSSLCSPFPLGSLPALAVGSFGAAILLAEIASWIPMPGSLKSQLESLVNSGALTFIVSAVIVAPFVEEVFFRGQLLNSFQARYSTKKAVWASAILFAVFHFNPWQAVGALPLGLAYAWLVLRTGSIIPGMISHAVANLSGSVLIPWCAKLFGYSEVQLEAVEHAPLGILVVGLVSTALGCVGVLRSLGNGRLSADSRSSLS